MTDGHIILPAEDVPPGVIEMSSTDTALLQVADIAAGRDPQRLDGEGLVAG